MHFLIFANGQFNQPSDFSKRLQQADVIIAVDGGADHCASRNIIPDILLGDLDSITPEVLESYKSKKTKVLRHPVKKDATDLELALDYAIEKRATEICILGALGGRWDMSLANIQLCAQKKYRQTTITISDENCLMHILRPEGDHILHGKIGSTVSLLPLTPTVTGITLQGFDYPLVKATIALGSSHGVSNTLQIETATISLESGVLLCIQLLQNHG